MTFAQEILTNLTVDHAERLRALLARSTKRDAAGCLIWTGVKNESGYGIVGLYRDYRRTSTKAHAAAYTLERGPVPPGLELDHLCRNRACCEPSHLEAVTKRVNTLRSNNIMAQNARRTHCIHGHEFTPENTYPEAKGRSCRACRKARNLVSDAKKKLKQSEHREANKDHQHD